MFLLISVVKKLLQDVSKFPTKMLNLASQQQAGHRYQERYLSGQCLAAAKIFALNTHFSKILFLENLFSTNVLQLLHIGRTHSSKKNKLTPF